MDIDATRKLRPYKAQEPPPPPPPPAPPPYAPPAEEVHTIRFARKPSDDSDPDLPDLDPVTGWLVVMKGCGRGRSLSLGYGIHSVGRADDQRLSVRFGDKKISRRHHAEIVYDGDGCAFYISPGRGGSSLAYLNGQPVLQSAPLRQGDRIKIGDTELRFVPFCGESFDWQKE